MTLGSNTSVARVRPCIEDERSETSPGAKRRWRAAEGRMRQLVVFD